MATTLIRNGCFAGALGGLLAGRRLLSITPSDYASYVNAADAIASECLTENAALQSPMADADNAQIGELCEATAYSAVLFSFSSSTTAADYLAIAKQIVASAKQGVAKLV